MAKFERLAQMAQRLIKNNGRSITLVRFGDTPTDPNRPWKGRNPSSDAHLSMIGVFVPPNTVRQFGLMALGEGTEWIDLVTKSQQIIIVSQGEHDISEYAQVIDGQERWGVIATQELRPGDLNLLGFIGVRR